MQTKPLTLQAPISGILVPLEQVPDPVFAQKMVGDGISIDPTNNQLIAPCAGTIIQIHRAHHAVTLKSPEGIEILMHIGIDTVALKGVGFTAHITEGSQVATGDLLLSFDADFVATKATSLLTQILVTNGELVTAMDYSQGTATANKTPILTLHLKNNTQHTTVANGASITSAALIIPNPQGLHARPCAMLAGRAKEFNSTINLHKNNAKANAKSVVAIMGLEIERADSVYLSATGTDAEAAIQALTVLIESGLGETCEPISAANITNSASASPGHSIADTAPTTGQLKGICASHGMVVGNVWQLIHTQHTIAEQGTGAEQEQQKLTQALSTANAELKALAQKAPSSEQQAIFTAHCELLADPSLIEHATTLLHNNKSAAWAWRNAYEAQAKTLAALKNALLAARATDLRDVGLRVLNILNGIGNTQAELPENCILIADDLTPSDTANLDPKRVLGFCTATGGASSHVAIIARSLNIPAIAGIDKKALRIANGTPVLLRADQGLLIINPEQNALDTLIAEREAEEILNEAALMVATQAATTACGTKHIEVVCNVGKVTDVADASTWGAEGVGLLRSEFLFMERTTAPSEDEQTQAYSQVANAFAKTQKIIIRTLDVGGDKPLSYLPLPKEENPFLGLRGIRVSLAYEALFRTQLRAILRASSAGNVHVMFPMITTLEDLRQAKAILEEERKALALDPIPVGIMVEVPSVAMLAEQFAQEVDFFSVGTNDLTQYTLAVDRGHPNLAKTADPLNPAVLAMIARAVEGAHKHNTWVGVCGGIASDPVAVPILIGLGVDELSGSLPTLPRVKAAVRDQNLAACKALAKKALAASTADDVRALLANHKTH